MDYVFNKSRMMEILFGIRFDYDTLLLNRKKHEEGNEEGILRDDLISFHFKM